MASDHLAERRTLETTWDKSLLTRGKHQPKTPRCAIVRHSYTYTLPPYIPVARPRAVAGTSSSHTWRPTATNRSPHLRPVRAFGSRTLPVIHRTGRRAHTHRQLYTALVFLEDNLSLQGGRQLTVASSMRTWVTTLGPAERRLPYTAHQYLLPVNGHQSSHLTIMAHQMCFAGQSDISPHHHGSPHVFCQSGYTAHRMSCVGQWTSVLTRTHCVSSSSGGVTSVLIPHNCSYCRKSSHKATPSNSPDRHIISICNSTAPPARLNERRA